MPRAIKVYPDSPADEARKRERLTALTTVQKMPLWLKIIAAFLGVLFLWLFLTWCIWAMQDVVIPRVWGR